MKEQQVLPLLMLQRQTKLVLVQIKTPKLLKFQPDNNGSIAGDPSGH